MSTEVYENERQIKDSLSIVNDLSTQNIYADNLPTISKLTLTINSISSFDIGGHGPGDGLRNGPYWYALLPATFPDAFANMFDGDISTWSLIPEIEQAVATAHWFTNLGNVYRGFFVCYYKYNHPGSDGPYQGPVYFEPYSLNINATDLVTPANKFFSLCKTGFKSDYLPQNDYWLSGSFCEPFYGDHVGLIFNNTLNTDANVYISRWDVYVFDE